MITPEQFALDQRAVQINGKTGVVLGFIPIDGSPFGGVRVEHEGGVGCAYHNDAAVVVVGAVPPQALGAVGPWIELQNPGPEWVCFYAATRLLAGRADAAGWVIYYGLSYTNGVAGEAVANRAAARRALAEHGVDVAALPDETLPVTVAA